MLFYLLCFALILLLPFIKNKGYTLATLFCLAFIMGIRDMIGSKDMYYYSYFFERFSFLDLWHFNFYEPGFKTYTILLKCLSNQREFFFFITAFSLIFLQSFAVKRWIWAGSATGFYLSYYVNFICSTLYIYANWWLRDLHGLLFRTTLLQAKNGRVLHYLFSPHFSIEVPWSYCLFSLF